MNAGTLISQESQWRFWPGDKAPSEVANAWVQPDFADERWRTGTSPFRYGDGLGGTLITGMQNSYSSFFLRQRFIVSSVSQIEGLMLNIDYDDGFAVWLNGSEVLRANAPLALSLNGFAPANHESGAFETFSLDEALILLREGENVIAIQGYNTNLPSSDFMLHPELVSLGLDLDTPTVLEVDPVPGAVERFSNVIVTFSEPVRGVDAADLSLNGVPATRVRASGNSYQFTFANVEPGELTLRWEQDNGIQDLASNPNLFDWQAPTETRQYLLVDANAPFVSSIFPLPNQVLHEFSAVEVLFSEPVVGLDSGDLLLNGEPATQLSGAGAGPYQFDFSPRADGIQNLEWALENGIEDSATEPNSLQTTPWQYRVDPGVRYGGVVISEIMAGNQSGLVDESQDHVDWIELHNTNDFEIDLAGWSLTDDPRDPGKWMIDDLKIEANGYQLIFASAKDRPNLRVGVAPHTNFRLSRAGEFLGLYSPEFPRRLVSDLGNRYPEQRNDHSYGLRPSGGFTYFAVASPGAENSDELISEILPKPVFSAQRGFYDQPFQVSLSSPVEGASVRYTVDLSEPSMENGIEYNEPINITRRFTVRAACFKPGFLPSETVTHSYLYRVSTTRRSLPILSLVTERENLFGPRGIMETNPRNTSQRGREWERPVSVEYFLPDGSTGFQIDCGLRIQGGNYVRQRYNPSGGLPFSKYSYRLYFRGDYGESALTYPIIPRSPADEYKQIVLRAGMNDHSNPFVVDELVRRLSADMGQVSAQGTLVNLYVNGIYKGYYNPTERIDEDFLDTWQGGNGRYDIIAQFGEVRAGDTVEWDRLKQTMSRDLSNAANYEEASRILEIDSFIDYLILNIYVGTRDWPHNNWRAARERVANARWRFYVWDAEWSFFNQGGSVGHNTLTTELAVEQDIARFYQSLSKNNNFRTRFADRVHRHFFGEGALTDENVMNRFQELKGAMSSVLRNMANNIATTWIPRRREIVFGHLAAEGLFLEDNIPSFSQEPGSVQAPSVNLSTAEGSIYYTLDGSDPFVPETASGDVLKLVEERSTKQVLVPVDSSVSSNWRRADRGFEATGWKLGRGGVGYDEAQTYRSHIRIDVEEEMNDNNTSVYVRIPFNVNLEALEDFNLLNLSVKYDDGFVAYLNGIRVAEANAPTTLRWNASASGSHADAAAVVYQSFRITEHMRRLRDGENILAIQGLNAQLTSSDFLLDALLEAGVVESGKVAPGALLYEDAIAIEGVTEIRARSFSNGRWSAQSRGVFYPGSLTSAVRFSEIMYHPPGGDEFEFLELSNFGPVTVDLSKYRLRGVSYSFPFGSFLDPGASVLLASNQKPFSFEQRYPEVPVWGYFGGSLSNAGESLVLEDVNGRYVTGVTFGDEGAWPKSADGAGYSLELVSGDVDPSLPSGWWQSAVPGGSPGSVQSLVPQRDLVISEVVADNRSVKVETGVFPDWVEVLNRGETPAILSGLRLRDESGGPDFVFPSGQVLEPGERIVVWESIAGTETTGLPFGLDRDGDSVILLDAHGRRLDAVTFGRQLGEYSLSRMETVSWDLGLPSPGMPNREAETESLQALRINELMANPQAGDDDWLELYNTSQEAPLSLDGLHFQLNGHVVSLVPHSFLDKNEYAVLYSDLATHHESLRFRLPAIGGELNLLDAEGFVIDQIQYVAQEEGASLGRLPNGVGDFQSFSVNPSPGQANYPASAPRIRINEVMARNQSLRYPGVEGTPDWIEIMNLTSEVVDLGGVQIRLSGGDSWSLPAGTTIRGGGLVTLWFDGDELLRRGSFPGLSVPVSLSGDAEDIELIDTEGHLIDRVVFGPQLADRSIGRVGEQWALLSLPTPGLINAEEMVLGGPDGLLINEWRGGGGSDWLELFNTGLNPVLLSGLYLSDDPSLAGKTKHQIAPLSFIGAQGWVVFQADGEPERGGDHLNFRLNAEGETLRLYNERLGLIDEIAMTGTEDSEASSGRLPDGSETLVTFAQEESSPGDPNTRLLDGVSVNEVLTLAQSPFEAAIELYNGTDALLDISDWWLGWSRSSLDAFRIPSNTTIEPGAFEVIFENSWSEPDALSFLNSKAVFLSEIDSSGMQTGRRIVGALESSELGQSVGVIETSSGSVIGRLEVPSFGVPLPSNLEEFREGSGQVNSLPWVGSVVISEIMRDAIGFQWASDSSLDGLEYIEIVNRSVESVELSSETDPSLGWRLSGGVDYSFQSDVVLPSGGIALIVNFNPEDNVETLAAFRDALDLPSGTLVFGPFKGRLENGRDQLRLQRLYRVPSQSAGETGELVWLNEDLVDYESVSPWPIRPSGSGGILSRIELGAYGNEAQNWAYHVPSPGRLGLDVDPNVGEGLVPRISLSGERVELSITASTDRTYRIQYADSIESDSWQDLQIVSEIEGDVVVIDPDPRRGARFYRVLVD